MPPKKFGKVADTRQCRGERAGGREWPGNLGVRSQPGPTGPTHPRPGRGRPALRLLLTCGGGGGDCSGRGRNASCGCAHGRAGAGPVARLGPAGPIGGRWMPRTHGSPEPCVGNGAVRPPEVNPTRSAALRLRSSGRPRWRPRGAREAVYRDLLARLPLERSLVRTDCSLRKAGSSHKLPSPK